MATINVNNDIKKVFGNGKELQGIIVNNNIIWPYIDKEVYIKFSVDSGVTYNYLISDENGVLTASSTKPADNNKKWKINLNKNNHLLLRPKLALGQYLKYDYVYNVFSLVNGIEANNEIFINKNENIVITEEQKTTKNYSISVGNIGQATDTGITVYPGSTTLIMPYPIKSVTVTNGYVTYKEGDTSVKISVTSPRPNATVSGTATIILIKPIEKTIAQTIDNINLIDNNISNYIITNKNSTQAGLALSALDDSNFSTVEIPLYTGAENTLEVPNATTIFMFED